MISVRLTWRHAIFSPFILKMCCVLAAGTAYAQEVQFDTSLLGIGQGADIDISRFANPDFIPVGRHPLMVIVNGEETETIEVTWVTRQDDESQTVLCLSQELIALINLKTSAIELLNWDDKGTCADYSALEGFEARADLSNATLNLIVASQYIENTHPGWVPPARWEHGINGAVFDYNFYYTANQPKVGAESRTLSGTGVAGLNLGAWRLRGDWQSNKNFSADNSARGWRWNRLYAFRPLPALQARLTLGEDYYRSSVFDSFRFVGAMLESDDKMLPPNLRGYAPEITGIARTNALVVISQNGRILAERQVAAGAFNIQDLSPGLSGEIEVVVREQDGSEQKFNQQLVSIPFLTRPGQLRYKTLAGQVSDVQGSSGGTRFTGGELSYGINNRWSAYGGSLLAEDYYALSLGIGRDLQQFGAISADVTQSHASLNGERKAGKSWRVNYSKRFDELSSQITFAGYRFSERNFMNLQDFDRSKLHNNFYGWNSREMFTTTFNKQFLDSGTNLTLTYTRQTFWNQQASNLYNLSLSKNIDIGPVKNASLGVSLFRNNNYGEKDDGAWMQFSMPFDQNSRVSFESNISRNEVGNSASYSRYGRDYNCNVRAGHRRSGAEFNGFCSGRSEHAEFSVNAGYAQDSYTSYGAGIRGGVTMTAQGMALHPEAYSSGSRMLVDAGKSGIPFVANGHEVKTNLAGYAVLTDVAPYHKYAAQVNIHNLPDDAEVLTPSKNSTLTEGAIGYRKFDVVSGMKAMATIRLSDGSFPPFGATVQNEDGNETGIVSEDGAVYLSGINPNGKMKVKWEGGSQCDITLPSDIKGDAQQQLLLPCIN